MMRLCESEIQLTFGAQLNDTVAQFDFVVEEMVECWRRILRH